MKGHREGQTNTRKTRERGEKREEERKKERPLQDQHHSGLLRATGKL